MSTPKKPIAIYHEHQDWFRPLFSEFELRGTLYIRIDARQHRLDIAKPDGEFSLLFNRMSLRPTPAARGRHLLHPPILGEPGTSGIAGGQWTSCLHRRDL